GGRHQAPLFEHLKIGAGHRELASGFPRGAGWSLHRANSVGTVAGVTVRHKTSPMQKYRTAASDSAGRATQSSAGVGASRRRGPRRGPTDLTFELIWRSMKQRSEGLKEM